MHTLGINHEHDREDRDSYVTIEFGNVDPDLCSAFNIAPDTTNLSLPYDFSSVIHYSNTAFSTGSEFTIKAKDDRYQYTMGQRQNPSFKDIALMNKQYCVCKNQVNCGPYGGYLDPNKCGSCKCPPTSEGYQCSNPVLNHDCHKDGPGYNVMVTDQLQTLKSPDPKTKDTCGRNITLTNDRVGRTTHECVPPTSKLRSFVAWSNSLVADGHRPRRRDRSPPLLYRVAADAPDNYPGFMLTYVEDILQEANPKS
ncbi:zinc metalloproteinase dpy-31 [Aphelenchoides avenae]|nr:zinc metalloproteinase dpy-31 [Aphelenchus avenae]